MINQQTSTLLLSPPQSFYVQQISTACLAEYCYYVESNGEAAVIDPIRDIKEYLELAKARNSKIKYILQTHFHADFVSGHVDLARQTGAKIVYGPNATAEYELYSAKDNEELPLGDITFKLIHTPGHTLESSCYLLQDENKKPYCVFTGDTLFLGEVGRPDLAVNSELKKEDLASMMYDSLRNKVMQMPDDVIVYPGHGAGSSCGKHICKGNSSTIGNQKKTNYALQPMTKEEFIQTVAGDLGKPPKYYPYDAVLNKSDLSSLDEVLKRSMKPLTVEQVKALQAEGAVVVDCREISVALNTGIIPNSITISLTMPFAVWAGSLLHHQDKIVIVCDEGKEEEAVTRLARVGFDNAVGYLQGGFKKWVQQNQTVEAISSVDSLGHLDQVKKSSEIHVLDIRNLPEWENGIYKGAQRISLSQLGERVQEVVGKGKPIHILCNGGFRAAIAYCLLRRNGFDNLTVIRGGVTKLVESGFKLDAYTVQA